MAWLLNPLYRLLYLITFPTSVVVSFFPLPQAGALELEEFYNASHVPARLFAKGRFVCRNGGTICIKGGVLATRRADLAAGGDPLPPIAAEWPRDNWAKAPPSPG